MKRRTLAIAAVAAAFALGLVAGALWARPTTDKATAPSPEPGVPRQGGHHGPASERSQPTERGARAAAIAYATAQQDWLYLSDEEVERSVRAMATETSGTALSADTVAEVRIARAALARSPGRVWWLVRPLASRVERLEPTSARVVVWTMTVLSAADVALPQADWARVSVELVWAGGAWRAQSIAEVPGPTPMVGTKDRP